MRAVVGIILAVGCGSVPNTTADAPPVVDGVPGPPDGPPGPDARCVDTVILAGGSDPAAQGWTVVAAGFFEMTYPDPQTTQLHTEGGGIEAGGTLVLTRPGTLTVGRPFIVDFVVRVVLIETPHINHDTGAGLMGSYTTYPGTLVERAETVYFETNSIGWTDNTQSATGSTTDNFHTYRLAVDANDEATVSRDGNPVLARPNFTTNGTIAFGDWTDRHFIEATTQIRSVTKVCPP